MGTTSENGFYDPEEVFRDFLRASEGTDADMSGLLVVEKQTGKSPYQQLRDLRGIQWPAPTAEIAKHGGTARRYMKQEGPWPGKPYGDFRHADGKLHIHMCHQDYSQYREVTDELANSTLRQVAMGLILVLATSGLAHAHHFKGLPHYNYFENYP